MLTSPNRKLKYYRNTNAYCGVLQCNTYRKHGFAMFVIPQKVRESPELLGKWSEILRNGNPFPKNFYICCRHFEEDQMLMAPEREGVRRKVQLCKGAFPTLNLPKFNYQSKKAVKRKSAIELLEPSVRQKAEKSLTCEEDPLSVENENVARSYEKESKQLLRQLHINSNSKNTHVNFDHFVAFSYLCCQTDEKLKIMIGLDGRTVLDALASECLKLRPQHQPDYNMPMKDKIILSIFKLKANVDFMQLAALFQISEETVQEYFSETIKCLAEIVDSTINLQSKAQIAKNSPTFFGYFPNVRLGLECIEIKSLPSLKVVIGFAPSGLINYVSKVANGQFSDKAMIKHQVGLLQKLERGDAVLVDKDLFFRDDIYGIEVKTLGKNILENKRIIEARADIQKYMLKLKTFKVLSEKIESSLVPLMDEIVTVLCGLSNKSLSIAMLND